MKLLLDQNLSWRLARHLQDIFPGTVHIREVGLERADDTAVWQHAKQGGYVILSKDSDFQQRSLLLGAPPKCIWTRVGNCTTDAIEHLIRDRLAVISNFVKQEDESYLILA